ncbi:MAG: hypothetical protein P8Y10_02905, partial [Gemmatimonadales bacterium]
GGECHRLGMFGGRGMDVDVVLDLMIHDIDLLLSFVRSPVTRISAVGVPVISQNVDIANARLTFANGCVANVTASRVSMRKQRKIRIFQEDAYVSMDFVENQIDLASTLFIVASKSGTTLETMSFYRYFRNRLEVTVGAPGSRFIAITDPGTPLADEAAACGFRACFENPPDIGGRYSVLSYFGLVPMALCGVPIEELLERARAMRALCGPVVPASHNQGTRLGTTLATLALQGRDKVTFTATGALSSFALWAEQLIAESTGKNGRGLVPIADEPLGDPSEYGSDRVFVWLGLEAEAEKAAAELDRLGAIHPVLRFQLPDRLALGGEFYRWELAIATAGALLHINPFDQPNVEESKRSAREVLSEWRDEEEPIDEAPVADDGRLAVYWGGGNSLPASNGSPTEAVEAIANLATSGDYVAILPYFAETAERDGALEALRARLRAEHHVATTIGYGPRYLHSTGQLHKGGPATGIFLLLTASPPVESRPLSVGS